MPSYRDTFDETDLVTAVREGADLPEQTWKALEARATPYQRRVARLLVDPTAAPHGQPGTYANWGCRCELCRTANSEDNRARRVREDFDDLDSDATPAQIQALRREVAAGRTLTQKGAETLAAYDATGVI